MNKILATLLLSALSVASLSAQTADSQGNQPRKSATTRIISGAVIDKNGNPLPGATVQATGGAETVTTDSDGTFSIEVPIWLKSLTASYPGIGERKLKTTAYDQMIFTIKPHYRTYGFVSLMFANVWQVGAPSNNIVSNVQQLGLMGGAYRSWGGYAKVMFGLFGGGKDYYGDRNVGIEPTSTAGVIKRINNNFNVFLGVGVGFNYGEDEYSYNHEYSYRYGETTVAGAVEIGAMAKYKKLNVVLGVTYVTPGEWTINNGNIALFCGLGINI